VSSGSGKAPGKARFRLRFERVGQALWWDQGRFLNALRAVLERAGLEPRAHGAYIAAGPPSPPGCTSPHEYADLTLALPMTCSALANRVVNGLEAGLHACLRLRSIVRVPVWGLDIRKAIEARCFEVIHPGLSKSAVTRFMAASTWPWTRWKRGAARRLDVRGAVSEMICLSGRVRFALECTDGAPRPAEVMASVFGLPLAEALLLPTACTGVRMVRQPVHGGKVPI